MFNDEITLVLDVETANDTIDALVYDVGGRFIDSFGKVYDEFNYVIREIFVYEKELMASAYYAEKIPEYRDDIQHLRRQTIDFLIARRNILAMMAKHNCHTIAAYNCAFDRNALNTTLRFLTKSKMRWFFPFNTNFICIWNSACNSICQTSDYKTFAETSRFYSNNGKNYRATAETVYAFLTNNPDFQEEHKGLDDVKIEVEILLKCAEMGTVMGVNRGCWQKVKRGMLMPLD